MESASSKLSIATQLRTALGNTVGYRASKSADGVVTRFLYENDSLQVFGRCALCNPTCKLLSERADALAGKVKVLVKRISLCGVAANLFVRCKTMTKEQIAAKLSAFLRACPLNTISADSALRPDLAGLVIYEDVLVSFGSADDELFAVYKSSDIIGDHHMTPREWLPTGNTVISYFLSYTDAVKRANAQDFSWPADEWLCGRYEGQQVVAALATFLQELLIEQGFQSVAPSLDPRFKAGGDAGRFTSNWSERHAAYVSGLGTFALTKGIITEKGACGRLGSVITALELPVTARPYSELYEYCIGCGVCISNCPVQAISFAEGKLHQPCSDFSDKVLEKHRPRYGCGKCQVGVPCESGIPRRAS